LDGVEGWDQEIPSRSCFVATASDVALGPRVTRATPPAGLGRTEDDVDRRPFGRRRERPDDVQIHRGRV
jgi:hypothetical protein